MKKLFYIPLLFVLVACENIYEDTHRYSRPYYLTNNYPIYLDASEILVDIQVKPSINPDAAFKITSNDRYFFVGEKMKGIHVYEKIDESHVNPLCFIECKLMKAFDVADNLLYCNNFTDLLVIDVENPLQAKILHREKDYFNKYYNSSFNIPYYRHYQAGVDVYQIGYKTIVLEGIETDTDPAPDFSDYNQLYLNLIVKEIPADLQLDMPFTGIANVEGNIFTFGYNCLAQCSYTSGKINIIQWGLNIPNYTTIMPADNLQYKDGMIFLTRYYGFLYLDYHNIMTQNQNYRSWYNVLDVVSIKDPANSFAVLSNNYTITGIGTEQGGYSSDSFSGTTSLINVNDTILALGNELMLYQIYLQNNYLSIKQVKSYSGISGTSMLRDGDVFIVANKRGLSFYDISDLKKITLIP